MFLTPLQLVSGSEAILETTIEQRFSRTISHDKTLETERYQFLGFLEDEPPVSIVRENDELDQLGRYQFLGWR